MPPNYAHEIMWLRRCSCGFACRSKTWYVYCLQLGKCPIIVLLYSCAKKNNRGSWKSMILACRNVTPFSPFLLLQVVSRTNCHQSSPFIWFRLIGELYNLLCKLLKNLQWMLLLFWRGGRWMSFKKSFFRPGKSWNFDAGPGNLTWTTCFIEIYVLE